MTYTKQTHTYKTVDDLMIQADVYRPRDTLIRPAILWLHGGALIFGNRANLREAQLARYIERGYAVIAVDYRLAPEHPFPAAIADSIAATAWIAENAGALGIDPERIAVAGDSGGGTLATIVCQSVRGEKGPRIAMQLLLCPVLDLGAETVSRQEFASGYLLDRAMMARDLAHYGPVDPLDPQVSPLRAADLAGMPRTLIHSAEFDPLRDEDAAYAERLRAAGVAVSHTCHAGMPHHFYGLTGIIPAARQSLDAICREARAELSR